MKCTIKIDMDNAAFDNPDELSRILRVLADRLETSGAVASDIKDVNGNTVGYCTISSGKRGMLV